MMVNSDHFIGFISGKYTYEIPVKYCYESHFINVLFEFELNTFREKTMKLKTRNLVWVLLLAV